MSSPVSWAVRAGTGFLRACVVAGVTLAVPAVWAVAVWIWFLWSGNPWSWIPLLIWGSVATLGLTRPVCRAARSLVARWTGTVIPSGYWEAEPVRRMSTGYWWNGFTYARSAKQARQEQEWRIRWKDPANWRDLRFVGIAPLAGLAAAVPPAALAVGITQPNPAGAFALLLAVVSAPYAWRALAPVAVRFLGPSPAMALAERVDELTAQRADMTVTQAAELRRIERDLHDGAQARLVSLGLSLATAEKLMERNPEQAKELMRSARVDATASLAELRELVRGISPPVLTERGLVDAVRALALDSPLQVTVRAEARLHLDPPVEAALYFGVAELLTNAAKHAHASHVRISLTPNVAIEIEDDGRGGADPSPGGGLAGLRDRLAVFDGTLEISSPPGGPTRVRMTVPCESS